MKTIMIAIVAMCMTVGAAVAVPASLSTPLDDNYTNNCNDPGQESRTDANGNTACYNASNGQPA